MSYGDQIRKLRDQYQDEHGITGDTDFQACAEWLVETRLYELPHRSPVLECMRELKKYSKEQVDQAGNRYWIHGGVNEQELWSDRREASWQLRQSHLTVLSQNVEKASAAAEKMRDVLNSERKTGEPEFQLSLWVER